MNRNKVNVLQLGVGFLLLFTGFSTHGFIGETILYSVSTNSGAIDAHAGYYSLAIVYAAFTLSNFLAPAVIAIIGPKWSMTLGSATYTTFLLSFLYLNPLLLYATSALLGFGSALLWTGQGSYLTLCSDARTAKTNSGIVWALDQSSLINSGIFLLFIFNFSKGQVSESTVRTTYATLAGLSLIGVITFACLRAPTSAVLQSIESGTALKTGSSIQQPPTTDHIQQPRKEPAHFAAIDNELNLGGASFGIFGEKLSKYGRTPIIVFGCLVHLICFMLTFLILPPDAPKFSTTNVSLIEPSLLLAMLCAALLGIGDSCWNTQIFSLLATAFKQNNSQAFAIFKFFSSLMSCASFYYGSHLELHWQLLLLAAFAAIATVCFGFVERRTNEQEQSVSPVKHTVASKDAARF
uniref:UNC93-like protein MFSD11 n=1 Tax=Plectus sambesii TaxID=2011161 RepID=A0A914XAM8_9BILA